MLGSESLSDDGAVLFGGCGPLPAHGGLQGLEERLLLLCTVGPVFLAVQGIHPQHFTEFCNLDTKKSAFLYLYAIL